MVPQHRAESSRTTLPRSAAVTLSVLVLLVALAVSAWAWLGGRGEVVPLEATASPSSTPLAAVATTPAGTVTVHVTGAVEAPGVYELPLGARVDDAIAVAGGLLADAEESALNRAQVLLDAQQVYVPCVGEASPAAGGAAGGGVPGLVNVNTASAAELEELPGVGPALAGRIIERRESRPFSSVEDLIDVPGIGPAILEKIRALVTM
ncbi:MAG: helix-hairpin-helix domain-containing protein [Actinomycetota bacterium]